MSERLLALPACLAILAISASAAGADTTVIGSGGQSNVQGIDSSQAAKNGVFGTSHVLGSSKPTTTQTSTNVALDAATIGGGDDTLIAPGGCFCQLSAQAVNSAQVGSGTQTSINLLGDGESIGDGLGDVVLIGGAAQTSQQGVNSAQVGASKQASINVLINAEAIGGGIGDLVVIGDASQANTQGIDSLQLAKGHPTQTSFNVSLSSAILG